MSEEPTSANATDMGALQSQLEKSQQQIERLKGTHAAVEKNRGELAARVAELEASLAEREGVIQSKSTESATLAQQMQEIKAQYELAESRASNLDKSMRRILVATGMVPEAPALATLIKNNALPSIEDDAQFEVALREIVTSLKGNANAEALKIVSGAAPAVAATTERDYSAMELEAMKLMMDRSTEARGRELLDQAMKLRIRSVTK